MLLVSTQLLSGDGTTCFVCLCDFVAMLRRKVTFLIAEWNDSLLADIANIFSSSRDVISADVPRALKVTTSREIMVLRNYGIISAV